MFHDCRDSHMAASKNFIARTVADNQPAFAGDEIGEMLHARNRSGIMPSIPPRLPGMLQMFRFEFEIEITNDVRALRLPFDRRKVLRCEEKNN